MTQLHHLLIFVLSISYIVVSAPVPQFTTEISYSQDDNWEPAIVADPNGGIYWASTRTMNQSVCENCPNPGMSFRYSSDNGLTFGDPTWVCMEECVGIDNQYDPTMAVDAEGRFYFAWMNAWNISFARSDDHGQSWSVFYPCVDVLFSKKCPSEKGAWGDKPWISIQGEEVWVFFSPP